MFIEIFRDDKNIKAFSVISFVICTFLVSLSISLKVSSIEESNFYNNLMTSREIVLCTNIPTSFKVANLHRSLHQNCSLHFLNMSYQVKAS